MAALVVLAAAGIGTTGWQREPADAPRPVATTLVAADATTGSAGALAALGTLLVGFTLTAAAGTVGRRRLDDREAARWDSEWARVEPEWSGRVP